MDKIMEQMPIVINALNVGFIQTLKLFFVTLIGALPLGLIRRNDPFDHLEQLDPEKDLALCHTEHQTGFLLPDWNTPNASPVNFREVAGIIENKPDGSSGKSASLAASPDRLSEHKARKIINDQKLDHKRCSPDDPDNDLRQPA